MNNQNLVSPKEAFDRGNLFDNYFWPYKYVANVKIDNEKDDLMLKIQIFCFAAHEVNLYLDLNPDDLSMVGLYNQYKEEANKYIMEYEKKYGLLELGINENYAWDWISSPWPWERR